MNQADLNPEHYVTVNNGERMAPALGPFLTDSEAKENVDRVRKFLEENDPHADAYEYGTFRIRSYGRKLSPGSLNKHMNN